MENKLMDNTPTNNTIQYYVRCAEEVKVTHWEYNWDSDFKDVEYNRLYLLKSGQAILHLPYTSITLEPGKIYLVPAYSVITSELVKPMEQLYIHFKSNDLLFESLGINKVYMINESDISKQLFLTVISNLPNNTLSSRMRIDGALNLLLADFINSSDSVANSLKKFEKVFTYVSQHLYEPFEIRDLANILNVNTVYFSNSFTKTFNISPKKYVTNKRLQAAQLKLLYTDLSIKEIAYSCGFDDEHYFMRVFKQHIGLTPSEMRNRVNPQQNK